MPIRHKSLAFIPSTVFIIYLIFQLFTVLLHSQHSLTPIGSDDLRVDQHFTTKNIKREMDDIFSRNESSCFWPTQTQTHVSTMSISIFHDDDHNDYVLNFDDEGLTNVSVSPIVCDSPLSCPIHLPDPTVDSIAGRLVAQDGPYGDGIDFSSLPRDTGIISPTPAPEHYAVGGADEHAAVGGDIEGHIPNTNMRENHTDSSDAIAPSGAITPSDEDDSDTSWAQIPADKNYTLPNQDDAKAQHNHHREKNPSNDTAASIDGDDDDDDDDEEDESHEWSDEGGEGKWDYATDEWLANQTARHHHNDSLAQSKEDHMDADVGVIGNNPPCEFFDSVPNNGGNRSPSGEHDHQERDSQNDEIDTQPSPHNDIQQDDDSDDDENNEASSSSSPDTIGNTNTTIAPETPIVPYVDLYPDPDAYEEEKTHRATTSRSVVNGMLQQCFPFVPASIVNIFDDVLRKFPTRWQYPNTFRVNFGPDDWYETYYAWIGNNVMLSPSSSLSSSSNINQTTHQNESNPATATTSPPNALVLTNQSSVTTYEEQLEKYLAQQFNLNTGEINTTATDAGNNTDVVSNRRLPIVVEHFHHPKRCTESIKPHINASSTNDDSNTRNDENKGVVGQKGDVMGENDIIPHHDEVLENDINRTTIVTNKYNEHDEEGGDQDAVFLELVNKASHLTTKPSHTVHFNYSSELNTCNAYHHVTRRYYPTENRSPNDQSEDQEKTTVCPQQHIPGIMSNVTPFVYSFNGQESQLYQNWQPSNEFKIIWQRFQNERNIGQLCDDLSQLLLSCNAFTCLNMFEQLNVLYTFIYRYTHTMQLIKRSTSPYAKAYELIVGPIAMKYVELDGCYAIQNAFVKDQQQQARSHHDDIFSSPVPSPLTHSAAELLSNSSHESSRVDPQNNPNVDVVVVVGSGGNENGNTPHNQTGDLSISGIRPNEHAANIISTRGYNFAIGLEVISHQPQDNRPIYHQQLNISQQHTILGPSKGGVSKRQNLQDNIARQNQNAVRVAARPITRIHEKIIYLQRGNNRI